MSKLVRSTSTQAVASSVPGDAKSSESKALSARPLTSTQSSSNISPGERSKVGFAADSSSSSSSASSSSSSSDKKSSKKGLEIDRKLLGHGGLENLDMMTPKEIDRKFKTLIGSMGVKEEKWMKGKYTTTEKKELITAIVNQHHEKADTPESFVKLMSVNPGNIPLDKLDALIEKLEDSEFVSLFLAADGSVALFEAILFALFKVNSLTGSDENDIPRLERLLTCVSTMINTGLGLEELLEIPNALKYIGQALEFVTVEKKTQVFEFFAAACLILEDSSLIMEALDFHRGFNQDSWDILLEELKENLDLKVAYFMLVNTLIVNTLAAHDRRKIRKTLMPKDVMAVFREDSHDADIQEQMSIFEEEIENDVDLEEADDCTDLVTELLASATEDQKALADAVRSTLRSIVTLGYARSTALDLLSSMASRVVACPERERWMIFGFVIKAEIDADKTGKLAAFLSSTGIVKAPLARPSSVIGTAPTAAAAAAAPAAAAAKPAGDPGKEAALAKELAAKNRELDEVRHELMDKSNDVELLRMEARELRKQLREALESATGSAKPKQLTVVPTTTASDGSSNVLDSPVRKSARDSAAGGDSTGDDAESANAAPAGGPPPPPPPKGGPPPPPPPGGKGGPPPPPPMMKGKGPPPLPGKGPAAKPAYAGPERPQMVQWRVQALPMQKLENTVFMEIKPTDIKGLDFAALESAFAVKQKPNPLDAAAAAAGASGAGGKKKENPKVLNPQRLQVLEIIGSRLKKPMSAIVAALLDYNKKELGPDVAAELKSMLPVKSEAFDEERTALLNYPNPSELVPKEQMLLELLKVPRLREKLAVVIFEYDVMDKLAQLREDMKLIKTALKELKAPKVVRFLEYSLAICNYLNSGGKNAKGPIMGFRIENLLKMVEVISPVDKQSVLHFLIRQLYEKQPELLTLAEDLASMEAASQSITLFTNDFDAVKKDFAQLNKEVKLCREEGNTAWDSALGKVQDKLTTEIMAFDEDLMAIRAGVQYFGEPADADLVAFFASWSKFIGMFDRTRKYVESLKAREAAAKKKEEDRKKKAEQKELLGGFVAGVKKSGGDKGLKPEQKEILSGLKKVGEKDEDGIIDATTSALKNKATFGRLRGHRALREVEGAEENETAQKISGKATIGRNATRKGTVKGAAAAAGGRGGTMGRKTAFDAARAANPPPDKQARGQGGGKTIREASMIVDDILSMILDEPAPAPKDVPEPTTGKKGGAKVSIMDVKFQ